MHEEIICQKNTLTTKEINPQERDWEYDGDGTKIHKLCGFGSKTLYDGGYLLRRRDTAGTGRTHVSQMTENIVELKTHIM